VNELKPDETLLQGGWVRTTDGLKPDWTCRRIEALTTNSLVKLGTDRSGWDTLYKDPHDHRLWELTFPDSDTQGGGPPRLRHMTNVEAEAKYELGIEGDRAK